MAWDRYAFVNNNPVRYTDPTGHYAKEETHYDLTYAVVYQLAYAKLISRGYSESAATVVAQSLADRIASADAGVDSKESAIPRPGTYTSCLGKGGCTTYTNKTTHHWYATPQAENELNAANTAEEFGVALHAYQDSFSHWQKLGEPDTSGEIWDGHYQNQKDSRLCTVESICVDTFDPSNPIDWAMVLGTVKYVNDFFDEVYFEETEEYTEEEEGSI